MEGKDVLIPRSIFGDVGWWVDDRQVPLLEAAPTLPNNHGQAYHWQSPGTIADC